VKNLLQRGLPTILSKYLQNEIGEIHKQDDFKETFLLIVLSLSSSFSMHRIEITAL
jgi:hypothetical protein